MVHLIKDILIILIISTLLIYCIVRMKKDRRKASTEDMINYVPTVDHIFLFIISGGFFLLLLIIFIAYLNSP